MRLLFRSLNFVLVFILEEFTMFNFLFKRFNSEKTATTEKEKVGIRKLLSNPNQPFDITISTKKFFSSIGTHEKRLILRAILDIYRIKADLKEPRKRVVKKPVKETTDAE